MEICQDGKVSMIYNILAHYYDGLVKDEDATKAWVNFTKKYIKGNEVMELACGSGEITLALAREGFHIDASDLSEAMISEAQKKKDANKVHFYVMDMNNFHADHAYDGILCYCDSINYLISLEQLDVLFQKISDALNPNGVFLFDTHSIDRLDEFQDEFYEEGIVEGHEYTWSIISEDPYLYHNFIFYDEDANAFQEQHVQRVYFPEQLDVLLKKYFDYEVYTDFDQNGICEGEKYFYICKKKGEKS